MGKEFMVLLMVMAIRIPLNRALNLLQPICSSYSCSRLMAAQPVPEIKFEELRTNLDEQKIALIDVREPQELKDDGKIPNSFNIPLGEIVNAFSLPDPGFRSKYGFSKPEKSETFALTCRSGKRATTAYNKIFPLGYENAVIYLGSFQDWVKNGGPIEK